jgi:G3E family GTPase
MAVVVVNAEQLVEGRDLEGTFEDQISSADLLLLNKIDLISQEALGQVEVLLQTLAPDTPTVRSVQGQVDPAVLFPPDPTGLRAQRRTAHLEPPAHQHDMFSAQEIRVEAGIEPDVLSERLRRVGALRAKGFVQTSQGLRLVQGVGRRIELAEVTLPPAPDLLGRVVVITRSENHAGARRESISGNPGQSCASIARYPQPSRHTQKAKMPAMRVQITCTFGGKATPSNTCASIHGSSAAKSI